jgi:hypothetical protein
VNRCDNCEQVLALEGEVKQLRSTMEIERTKYLVRREALETEIVTIRDELMLEKRLHNGLRERYTAKEQECIRERRRVAELKGLLVETCGSRSVCPAYTVDDDKVCPDYCRVKQALKVQPC